LSNIFTRVKNLYQARGTIGLLRDVLAYFRIYEHSTYYVYEHKFPRGNIEYSTPKIGNFTFHMLTTTVQLEELIQDGYNLVLNVRHIKNKIGKGAVGFCIFVDKELVATEWVAMTEKAKIVIDRQPYKVDFAKHEVCIGDAWTNPKYRRLGLNSYIDQKMNQYFGEKGVKKTHAIIGVSNTASLTMHEKHNPVDHKPCAIGHYLIICGLSFWKETPLNTGGSSS